MTVFCGNGATIGVNTLFMANAYARHINGDVLERAIFDHAYVVEVELPEGTKALAGASVLSDTRDPCFYARRHNRRLYMGYEETAETSPDITRDVARRTLQEGKRIFPALRSLGESDIKRAWAGRVYYTLDDYPFVKRRHGGRVITFAAPSDHGNALTRCASDNSSAIWLPIQHPSPTTIRTNANGVAARNSCGYSKISPRDCACAPAGGIRRPHSGTLSRPSGTRRLRSPSESDCHKRPPRNSCLTRRYV